MESTKLAVFCNTYSNFTKPHYLYSVERYLPTVLDRLKPNFSIFNGFTVPKKDAVTPRVEYNQFQRFMDNKRYNFVIIPGTEDDAQQLKGVKKLEGRILSPTSIHSEIPKFPRIYGFPKNPTKEQLQNIIIKTGNIFTVFPPVNTYSEEFNTFTGNMFLFGEPKNPHDVRYYWPQAKLDKNNNILVTGISSGFPTEDFMDELDLEDKVQAPYTNALVHFNKNTGELEKIEFYQLNPSEKLFNIMTYVFSKSQQKGESKQEIKFKQEGEASDFIDFREFPLAKKRLHEKTDSKTVDISEYATLDNLLKGVRKANDQQTKEITGLRSAIKDKGLTVKKGKKDKETGEVKTELIETVKPSFLKRAGKKLLAAIIVAAGICIPLGSTYKESEELREDFLLALQDKESAIVCVESQKKELEEQNRKLVLKDKRIEYLTSNNEGLSSSIEKERGQVEQLKKAAEAQLKNIGVLTKKISNLEGKITNTEELTKKIFELGGENAELNKRVEQYLSELKTSNQLVSDQKTEYQKLELQLKKAGEVIIDREAKINRLKQQLTFSPEELENLKTKLEKSRKQYLVVEEELLTNKKILAEKDTQITELGTQISELEKKLTGITPLPPTTIPEIDLGNLTELPREKIESNFTVEYPYDRMFHDKTYIIAFNGNKIKRIYTKQEMKADKIKVISGETEKYIPKTDERIRINKKIFELLPKP